MDTHKSKRLQWKCMHFNPNVCSKIVNGKVSRNKTMAIVARLLL